MPDGVITVAGIFGEAGSKIQEQNMTQIPKQTITRPTADITTSIADRGRAEHMLGT